MDAERLSAMLHEAAAMILQQHGAIAQKDAELAAFTGWYVMWEDQIPKGAREAIEARLRRIANESHTGKSNDYA